MFLINPPAFLSYFMKKHGGFSFNSLKKYQIAKKYHLFKSFIV